MSIKDATPEQAARAVITTVMMHALLNRCAQAVALDPANDVDTDEKLLRRAESLADKILARAFL